MKPVCVYLALPALVCGQSSLVFRNVRVFDGTQFVASATVVVEGSHIAGVGPEVRVPKGAREIDGRGKTLLPGFFDCHTHTIAPDTSLKQSAIFGVTTNLDMFTPPQTASSVKKRQAEGQLLDWADLRSSGFLATVPGGHGTEYGIAVPTITKPEEAQPWVDARIAEGSDYIKIIYDDASAYGVAKLRPTLSKETMKAIVDAAHKRGKLAVIHIGSFEQAKDAIEAGADGLAHLYVGPSSPAEIGKLVAAHHAFVIPTLTVLKSVCGDQFNAKLSADERLLPYLTSEAVTAMKQTFPKRNFSCEGTAIALRQLHEAHVPILAGTDVGNPGTTAGASLHGELELLVAGGLTPVEALRAATSAPSTAFHMEDRGRIAAGLRADLLLVNGDPGKDIRATRDIAGVWKAGREVDRVAFRETIAKQRQAEAAQRAVPAPVGSESGWIDDFEEPSTPKARFGAGWALATDERLSGHSVVKMEIAAGGAEGSKGALLVSGAVLPGFAYPFSGVMFSPGSSAQQPANLSSKKEIRFWAAGDGRTYQFQVYDQKLGYRPAIRTFAAGSEWKEYVFPFASFGLDGSSLTGFAWRSNQPGKFQFRLDNIRLQ